MANHTFLIAECGSCWRFGQDPISNAFSMIEAAKECGADAAKFQWTSDPTAMAKRRNLPEAEAMYRQYLAYPIDYLQKFKAHCDKVGIEFMVTCYLSKDIGKIAPLVSRFKIASAESSDKKFVYDHFQYEKPVIISLAFGSEVRLDRYTNCPVTYLHCVCKYPTPVEQLNLRHIGTIANWPPGYIENRPSDLLKGLSDHTTSVLAGALAVAMGATVVEKHARLWDTPSTNPDYPHSLEVGCTCERTAMGDGCGSHHDCFALYVENIREAEKAI